MVGLARHTPVHASWLNQVEVYFSIIQRKALSPNDFTDLDVVEQRLARFEVRYNTAAKATSSGSSPPTTWPTSWNNSTDTKKPKPQTVPNRQLP
jgi:hypothetical protein